MRLTSGHCPRKCDLCDSENAKRGAADGVEVKKKNGAKLQRVIVDIILDHDLQPQPKMVEDIRQHQYHRLRDQRLSQPGRNLLILQAWQPQQANDQPKDKDKVANSSHPLMKPMVRDRKRRAKRSAERDESRKGRD